MKNLTSKTIAIALGTTTIVSLLGAYVWHEENRPEVLEIYVFSLKSGNSMFIRTPDDMRYIINGGANSEIIRHITKVLPFYSRRIDGVFAADVDLKNVGGLISVIERYNVGKVYLPSETVYSLGLDESQNDAYRVLLDTIDANNIKVEKISAGMSLELGSSTKMEILFPFSVLSTNTIENSASSAMVDPILTNQLESFEYSKASSPELIMRILYKSPLNKNDGFSVIFLNSVSKKIQKSLKIEKSDVLVVTNGASELQLESKVADKILPKFVIYSKSDGSTKKTSSKSSGTTKSNILFAKILPQNRFNIKEGTVKILISNDDEIKIIQK